jgi:predicted nucleotidyltransferase
MSSEIATDHAPEPSITEEWLTSKRDDVLRVARAHGARRVRVFGSVARGRGRADSDLDLLLTLEPGTSLLDLIDIKQDVEDLLARRVDVVTESSISRYIRDAVLRDAVDL